MENKLRPIEEILASKEETIESLSIQKNLRDELVMATRGEMIQIHDRLEPLWREETVRNAGPSHLAQIMRPGVRISLGDVPDDKLDEMQQKIDEERERRSNRG